MGCSYIFYGLLYYTPNKIVKLQGWRRQGWEDGDGEGRMQGEYGRVMEIRRDAVIDILGEESRR